MTTNQGGTNHAKNFHLIFPFRGRGESKLTINPITASFLLLYLYQTYYCIAGG
ncbi:hypothetical protein HBHAL_5153 [Halobacillus halophilus DSM 2266]|uniref:Uncharacterized protein n=1 Tax=Halobacillus halophilus (strain ATCC 35676 / DSM 2266 / JCM 20832 / KCTC 3685 / LMG 17431 / NBRC 102448 / NCIMB 2269) TaxID=866895 RepID=I0JTL6_HALH3|nr:hypothetical protein HBHAL_5153 [Halobacillus halophilus DSM 2266]